MAFRQLRSVRPAVLAAGATITALLAVTTTPVHAQEAPNTRPPKKSLYDPPTSSPTPTTATTTTVTTTTTSAPESHTASPTPTDRLAVHIGTARRFIQAHTALAQREIDTAFARYLSVESSITSTIASLAPPRSSEEKVVPGLLFVAVTTMAGSIVARRRMLPIRAVTPVVVAVAAGWYFLPETSRNVGNLLWEWEKRVPGVAENHLLVRGAVERALERTEGTVMEGRESVDGAVREARRTVEGWVKKG